MLESVPSMAAYDEFAWFYNRYWNEDFHSLAFPILERIWLERVPAGARVLDVCCGTGHLAGLLAARGYRVTGVDLSGDMIRYARENVPGAEFLCGDAAAIRLPGPFEAAVSTFDSLNHILELADLEAAFRNTAAAMRPGGFFAFDMLLEEAYQTHWGESFALVRDDHVLTITGRGLRFPPSPGAVHRHHVPAGGRLMAAVGRGGAGALLHRRRDREGAGAARASARFCATTPATWEWAASSARGGRSSSRYGSDDAYDASAACSRRWFRM